MGSQNEHEVTREEHVNKFEQEKTICLYYNVYLKNPKYKLMDMLIQRFFYCKRLEGDLFF